MLRLIASITFFIFFLLLPCVACADSKEIKLGYLLDLSGKGAFLGQQSQAGAELAKKELLSSGIDVKILYEDHQADPKTSITGATKLINIDKVDAILCDLSSPCIAASPIVASAKRLFLYQAPVVSILATNHYAFKNFLNYQDGCRRIAAYWKGIGISRVSHFKINAEFGELCLSGAREIFPSEEEFEYDTTNDLRSLVARVKKSDVQAVFQTGWEADFINRFRASADLGLVLPSGMPEPLLTSTVIQSVTPASLQGLVTFGFPKISDEFVNRLKSAALYESPKSIESAAIAYLHVKQVITSILECPDRNISCELFKVIAAPPDSILGFKGWKNREASYDFKLRRWQDGELREFDAEQTP